MTPALQSRLSRVQVIVFIIGVLALAATALGAIANRKQFFFSYLFGYLFWLGVALGCFGVSMIHNLTGGRWGYPTKRFLEAGFGTLPLMALLFLPLFFGLNDLYPWARPGAAAHDEVLKNRGAYMTVPGFAGRAVFFFGVWIVMAWVLRKWSLQQDQTPDAAPTRKLRALSGVGVVIYPLTVTFAYVDWIMSLEAHWYSTMFGVIIAIGQILSAYAFSVMLLAAFEDQKPISEVVSRTHFHHLGNLLLTFVMFWTYVSFGQLLVIYSGNLPQEIDWYLHRIAGGWKLVIAVIALFHFFLPFFLLLFRPIKRRVGTLASLAALLFFVHIVDVYWMVMPSLHTTRLSIHWLDLTAPLGVGGIWLAVFLAQLKRAPLLPEQDPGLQFSLSYAH